MFVVSLAVADDIMSSRNFAASNHVRPCGADPRFHFPQKGRNWLIISKRHPFANIALHHPTLPTPPPVDPHHRPYHSKDIVNPRNRHFLKLPALPDMTDPGSPSTAAEAPLHTTSEASPQRYATLKKKNSIRRADSKRSNADTMGSTTLSPTSPRSDDIRNDVTRSPLYCPVPTNADPTVVLALRFQGRIR